ncbi:WD40 repeat-like protein [Paxillus ammoniavirescens]|nr:WD40 repeat-like protein [Paxillus ammoniavirescens]
MSRLYDATRNAYRRVRGLPLPQLVLIGHMDHTRSVAFLPDGNQVINPDDDGSIRARRVEDGEEVGTVMREKGLVLAVAASSDGHWIATGGRAKKVTIWNATTHEKVVEMTGHTGWVRSLAFSPDSARVASGSDDKTVIVWSTTTGERLAGPLEGHTYAVDCVQFSPDGDRIASCDYRDLRIWYSHVGELVIPPIQGEAWSLAWTPDGQQLIAGCYSGYITFIDTSTGSKPAEWKGHTHYVDSISLSHDGNFFASGSWDKTVRLWDTSTQQQIGPALQHDSYVHSVAISPDGHHLSLLGNTPTNPFVNVHEEDWKEVPSPPSSSQEALDTQNDKDCDKHGKVGMKDNPEGVDTALQRRTSETSSLRRFLDCPAVAPIGGAVDSSEQLYDSFFNNDLPDAPPPIDEPPKKQFSKFRQKFTWKKKDMKRPMQPEDQLAVAGADTEPAIDVSTFIAPQLI